MEIRTLVSGLSYVQVDKHSITIFTTYISVDLAHHEIDLIKLGKGGIKSDNRFYDGTSHNNSCFGAPGKYREK